MNVGSSPVVTNGSAPLGLGWIFPALGLIGLGLVSRYSYPMFHTLAELFSIFVAWGVFVLAWNSRRYLAEEYLLLVGITSLGSGSIDLLHLMSYQGVALFPGYDNNLPTSLWIAARYLQSGLFFLAALRLPRRGVKLKPLNLELVFTLGGALLLLLLWSVFSRRFPLCYIEGSGLTPFKKISECLISLLFLGSALLLWQRRHHFASGIVRLLVGSMVASTASELSFIFYLQVFDFPNFTGHLFKTVALYLLYRAIIDKGFRQPLALLFSELRSNQELLREQKEVADAANQAKGNFLANMSHEIRTPMNAVLGFAQLLARDPSLSPQALNQVQTIMKSGEHLLNIINDILEMSRIESGRIELRSEPVDLQGLLTELAGMFSQRAEEKGLAFTLALAPETPRYILTDQGKLRQILINLVGNAVKFTREGAIVLRVCPAGSKRLAIEVKDSGIGIAPEDQVRLFRPFVRTRSGEQTAGGTGLGLAISREFAHLLRGEITVSSEAGKGSCFRFEFEAPPTKAAAAEARPLLQRLAPGQGELRVLVVDDLASNRKLLRMMLERRGFLVEEAGDGQEALEVAQAWFPRIILMDLVMPGMAGDETTRILRSSLSGSPLTIIGISASVFEQEKEQFLASGIDAFLAKPFREQELLELLAAQAGVTFAAPGAGATPLAARTGVESRSLAKMAAAWREQFHLALARGDIARLRQLGEEAELTDPTLSRWIGERVTSYDLDGLKKLQANP